MMRHYPLEVSSDSTSRTHAEIIASDDFLRRHYRKVYIITPSLLYTIVPAPVYEPRLKDDYFRFNLQVPGDTKIFTNTVPFPDAVILFSPGNELVDSFAARWRDVTPWHHTKPLLRHVSTACRASDERYIHLHLEKSFATVICLV